MPYWTPSIVYILFLSEPFLVAFRGWRNLMQHLCHRHRENKRDGRSTDYRVTILEEISYYR
jgi:hypothetical protein